MPGLVLRLVLGGVLIAAAVLKLAAPERSRLALATFGLEGRIGWAAWIGLIGAELGLAAGVIAGSDVAALAAAALMLVMAGAMGNALLRGRAGEPCGCFGARSEVGIGAVAHNVILAAAFVLAALLPAETPSTEGWLAIGLGASLLLTGGLAIAVLALAREIGMLRLRLGPSSALEIPSEGPELGSRASFHRGIPGADAELAVAVFVSESCRVCRGLEPAIESLAREPGFAVEVFAEETDPEAWAAMNVPGSPYAVVSDLDGMVLAKGTFNNLAQLESVLATAQRRRERGAAAVG
jgi:Methylamine utilisation protein MauE